MPTEECDERVGAGGCFFEAPEIYIDQGQGQGGIPFELKGGFGTVKEPSPQR